MAETKIERVRTMTKWLQARQQFLMSIGIVSVTAILLAGCGGRNKTTTNAESSEPRAATNGSEPSETGVEKMKPAPGTGNVQGKVYFNSKPVANIEVRLCEKFSRFLSGCGGQIYNARTDEDGVYVITNVTPKTYEALTAQVFDTPSYIFATSGIAGISATKYEVSADKTFFVPRIDLFKNDLKTLNPKAGAKVDAQGLELKWEPYPDAAYYKFSIHADDSSVTSPYINERVEMTSVPLDKPLQKGTYRWQVEAYNKENRKLSDSPEDMKFTVN